MNTRFLQLFALVLVLLPGCTKNKPSDLLNAPASSHERVLSSVASKIAASAQVIVNKSDAPSIVRNEAELILKATGSPTKADLQEAQSRS